jgi:hypothetical protein
MRPVHDPLSSSIAQGMISHHLARMPDDDATRQHHDLNTLADQAPGHRVAVGVEVDRAIGLNLANQIPQLPEGCPSGQRAQLPGFVGKAFRRFDTGGAVFTLVGNFACPSIQMRFKLGPALEAAPGDRVLLDVTDPALVFAFLSSPGLQFVLTLKRA